MTTDSIETRVIEILAAQALIPPADVAPDAPLDALGLDSLGLVEAIFAIEESFGITVPFNANAPEDLAEAEEILQKNPVTGISA